MNNTYDHCPERRGAGERLEMNLGVYHIVPTIRPDFCRRRRPKKVAPHKRRLLPARSAAQGCHNIVFSRTVGRFRLFGNRRARCGHRRRFSARRCKSSRPRSGFCGARMSAARLKRWENSARARRRHDFCLPRGDFCRRRPRLNDLTFAGNGGDYMVRA